MHHGSKVCQHYIIANQMMYGAGRTQCQLEDIIEQKFLLQLRAYFKQSLQLHREQKLSVVTFLKEILIC